MAFVSSTAPPPSSLKPSSESSAKKKAAKKNPQAQLSQFWSAYHSKSPARVTSIFPKKLYNGIVSVEDAPGPQVRNAATTYEEARAKCKELVRRAVAECERMNCKYSDAEFDVETDFAYHSHNCLYGLDSRYRVKDDIDFEGMFKKKLSNWRVGYSLQDLVKSELVTDNSAALDIKKLGDMLSPDFSSMCGCCPRIEPESVHRVDWIFENPQFTVDGYSSSDIKQGKCGDCWWLAGLSSIAHRKDLMDKVCVARDEECGVYGFVFFKDGEWISTVIDDNLYLKEEDYGKDKETYDATGKKARLHKAEKQTGSKALFYSHCENENETWLPLLEKAYAKVHGDYEAIEGGWGGTAVEDLTGGVTTMIGGNSVLRKDRLWRELVKSGEEDGDFVFALSAMGGGWASVQNGITLSHAYSVLKATEIQDEDGNKHRLVRVRNPWGARSSKGTGEWFGPWSDGSREWTPYMIQKMHHKFGDDGNFWISFQDLLDNFKWLHRTRLFDKRWSVTQQWTSSYVSWVTGYLDKKFIIEVKRDGMVVIVLSQLDDRYFKGLRGQYKFSLDFLLRKAGTTASLCQVRTAHRSDKRSVNCELELEAGTYEVLPKITAERKDGAKTIGQVVKKSADENPEKLRQIGMQYDAAHAKAGVVDEDEEVEKLRDHNEKKKQKRRQKKRQKKKMEKAMKDMSNAIKGKAKKDDADDDDESGDERKGNKAKDKRAKGKKKNKTSSTHGVNGDTKSSAATKSSSPEGRKNKESDEDSSSEEDTPPSTVTSEKKDEDSGSDSDSDDSSSDSEGEPDFDKKQPWDPVCVMGLRVYAQDTEATVRLGEKAVGEEVAAKEEAVSVVKT